MANLASPNFLFHEPEMIIHAQWLKFFWQGCFSWAQISFCFCGEVYENNMNFTHMDAILCIFFKHFDHRSFFTLMDAFTSRHPQILFFFWSDVSVKKCAGTLLVNHRITVYDCFQTIFFSQSFSFCLWRKRAPCTRSTRNTKTGDRTKVGSYRMYTK